MFLLQNHTLHFHPLLIIFHEKYHWKYYLYCIECFKFPSFSKIERNKQNFIVWKMILLRLKETTEHTFTSERNNWTYFYIWKKHLYCPPMTNCIYFKITGYHVVKPPYISLSIIFPGKNITEEHSRYRMFQQKSTPRIIRKYIRKNISEKEETYSTITFCTRMLTKFSYV